MVQTLTEIKQRTHTFQRIILTILGLLEIREVASCTFYNANTFSFEHWDCPEHQICCIYYGAKSCCREKQAYMNTGYEHGGSHGNHHGSHHMTWTTTIIYYLKTHYTELLVVLSMLFVLVMVVICCLQWKKRMEEEAEEEELLRINQMIAMSEGHGGGSLYRPQPLCPLRHGEEPSENTTIAAQQPPSYDSVSKDTNRAETGTAQESPPPPPYKP